MPDGTTTAPAALGPFGLGGTVTTPYGVPNAINGQAHTGVDIGGLPIGTPIPAFVAGVVSRIWRDAAGGIQVSVKTAEGFTQTYAHLGAVNVQQDQQVSGSDIVGFLGNTGTTTGPHLHYEVQSPTGSTGVFASSVDPQTFLSEFFTSSSPTPSGSGSGPRVGNGPRPRALSPASSDACAMVPGETVKAVQNFIGVSGIFGDPAKAAQNIKDQFPSVPVSCLQQIAYGAANASNPQDDFLGKASRVLTDLLNPLLWRRSALAILGASLIVAGVILYTRPSAAAGAVAVVREAV